ncbi:MULTISPECIES: DUF2268 domain-containing protein [unclassified Streptomyces]|uniref:DUF2268 domain-containing protein n=1 Tax=unclassified Streptomyces TaxID=2593676 RepID=UPI00378E4EE4
MKIVVHDTASALLDLLHRPQAQRPDALREIFAPLQEVMSRVGVGDLVETHRAGSGFRLDRDEPRHRAALEQMREARVWQRVEESLAAAQDRLAAAAPDARTADTVHVVLVLGDPDDPLLALNQGYFGLGGIPGAILLTMWPTATGLAKIGHAAAHELHHNVRYANVVWDPVAVTVGEQVVAEGLAEAFVRELAGEPAMGPWTRSLSGTELDEVCAKVAAGIDVAGMPNIAGYLYGDSTMHHLGQRAVGLPDFAGYAAGLRFVDAHLTVSGLTAAASVALPAREVLGHAGVPTAA